ncbi:MAG: N-6 DNA methylase [Prolixibacteraceae bacterium]|jgi:type I restriction-modification system DNA methylase subunit|nr:N-6 DNA methylase [Prolixibacteraceae bacterium]
MSIFQKSVINNHLSQLDKEQVDKAFEKFIENYSFSKIAEIQKMKEEEYQDGFLRDIFVDVFGYTLKPADNYNLAREFKNQTDGKKADGAILKNDKAIAVIELKSTKTKDLTNVTQQAFNYKNNQPECKYVITSNFQKLRFYIDYSNEYEEFDLFNLPKDNFQLLYLLLQKDSILTDLPLKLKTKTKFHEENISDKLYKDYSSFKYKIYNNLVKNNPQYDKLTLFKKSQKFLDRLLFVFFAEDTGLVPPNAISKIVEQWQFFIDNDEYFSLYSRFVKFFIHLDKGHKYKTYDLPAYNGGLFAPDEILDSITLDDEVLKNDALLLSSYDYSTEVDVNILGHIFEHSLNEIEEITAEIEGTATDKNKTKRKKDGVFYTPKYITQYIVENTIGTLCIEKREKLGILEIEFDESIKTKNGKISATGKKLFETLQAYKDWLFSLKIVDPACGSGAFLNQALNFLINEHQQIDDIIAELTGEKLRLFDTDKTILEKNLYGVDINDESVEIAKLSLWLRTAQKGRKLSKLNNNIKCGNSLLSSEFNWHNEFPEIMKDGGFDVVIGNPPYVRADSPGNSLDFREYLVKSNQFETLAGKWDLYIPFIEKSIQLTKTNGKVSLIIPDAYCHAEYAKKSIEWSISNRYLYQIDYFPDIIVFQNVGVKSVIVNFQKMVSTSYTKRIQFNNNTFSDEVFESYPESMRIDSKQSVLDNYFEHNYLSQICYSSVGIVGNSDEKKYKGEFLVGDLLSEINDDTHQKLYFEGKDIGKWILQQPRWIEYGTDRSPSKWRRKGFTEMFEGSPKLITMRSPGIFPRTFLDDNNGYFNESAIGFKRWIDLQNVNNNSLNKAYGTEEERTEFEKISAFYSYNFLLAILNSSVIRYELNTNRRSNIHIYPEDWKTLKIPKLNGDNGIAHEIENRVKIIIQKSIEFQNKNSNLLNYLQSKYEIERFSNKLQNWHELESKDFLKELQKAKVKLSLSEEAEWLQYFNEQKEKAQTLKSEIEKTDKEIDQMVYKLYDLTDDEIAIVENSLK